MKFPAYPVSGDLFGIAATSAGVGHKLASFDASLDVLRSQGYRIREGASVRHDALPANTAEVRGWEFNELLADPEVSVILAAAGGNYALEMLPYLDPSPLKHRPKWVAGASDPTNILYYLTTQWDIATLYGFNAGSFDWRPLHRFQEEALAILAGDLVEQGSHDYCDAREDYSVETPQLTRPVRWACYRPEGGGRYEALERFSASGRLLGGCIDCIAHLIGTPYDGTGHFLERYDQILWYFDNYALSADALYAVLLQMRYAGYFRGAQAVVFGRTMFPDGTDSDYHEHISRALDVPFLWNTDIGHVKPCFTLINGAIGELRYEQGRGSLSMHTD